MDFIAELLKAIFAQFVKTGTEMWTWLAALPTIYQGLLLTACIGAIVALAFYDQRRTAYYDDDEV